MWWNKGDKICNVSCSLSLLCKCSKRFGMTRYLSKTKESDGRNVLHFIKLRIFHHLIPRKMNKVYLLFVFSVVYCILFVALWVFLKLVSLATYMYIRKPQDMQLLWHHQLNTCWFFPVFSHFLASLAIPPRESESQTVCEVPCWKSQNLQGS